MKPLVCALNKDAPPTPVLLGNSIVCALLMCHLATQTQHLGRPTCVCLQRGAGSIRDAQSRARCGLDFWLHGLGQGFRPGFRFGIWGSGLLFLPSSAARRKRYTLVQHLHTLNRQLPLNPWHGTCETDERKSVDEIRVLPPPDCVAPRAKRPANPLHLHKHVQMQCPQKRSKTGGGNGEEEDGGAGQGRGDGVLEGTGSRDFAPLRHRGGNDAGFMGFSALRKRPSAPPLVAAGEAPAEAPFGAEKRACLSKDAGEQEHASWLGEVELQTRRAGRQYNSLSKHGPVPVPVDECSRSSSSTSSSSAGGFPGV